MMAKEIPDTSIAVSLFRYVYRRYGKVEQKAIYLYQVSQTYGITQRLCKKIKIIFRNSFLGRGTEIKLVTPEVLDNSRIVQYLISLHKRWREGPTDYLRTSLASGLVRGAKEGLSLSTARTAGTIIITIIIINAFLSLAIHKQIGLWGWLMRGLFLLAACAGLFSKADWPTIKSNSRILRNLGC